MSGQKSTSPGGEENSAPVLNVEYKLCWHGLNEWAHNSTRSPLFSARDRRAFHLALSLKAASEPWQRRRLIDYRSRASLHTLRVVLLRAIQIQFHQIANDLYTNSLGLHEGTDEESDLRSASDSATDVRASGRGRTCHPLELFGGSPKSGRAHHHLIAPLSLETFAFIYSEATIEVVLCVVFFFLFFNLFDNNALTFTCSVPTAHLFTLSLPHLFYTLCIIRYAVIINMFVFYVKNRLMKLL